MNNVRLEKLKQMEHQKPEDAFLKFAIAQEYASLGSDDEAKSYYELLLAKFPAYVPTYYHVGKLYERIGEMNLALEAYKTGIEKAKAVNDMKNLGELNEALMLIADE